MPQACPATYYRDANGISRSSYECTCHGQLFPTRQIMLLHQREYKKRIARDLQSLVREGGLGQNCWDRLPGETPVQHSRFISYLNYRAIHKVAAVCSIDVIAAKKLASKWQWVFRALAYDDHLAKQELRAFEEEKAKSARRQAKLGQRLQAAALAGANQLITRVESNDVEMSGNEIAKLADVGVKVERLANQDPTAIKEDRGIRFVWEGPRPAWAPADPAAEAKQIEGTVTPAPEAPNA